MTLALYAGISNSNVDTVAELLFHAEAGWKVVSCVLMPFDIPVLVFVHSKDAGMSTKHPAQVDFVMSAPRHIALALHEPGNLSNTERSCCVRENPTDVISYRCRGPIIRRDSAIAAFALSACCFNLS